MKTFADYITEELLLEKAGKAGSHLVHIEDLPFSTGDEGIEHAANILDDLDTMLSGKQKQSFNAPKAKSFVAGKFDGAPAIIFGIDPQTKKFFVASKSAFNVTPKINYTMEDIEKNHGSSPGLSDKLRQALMYLPSVTPKKGVYQGDFMYDRWSIRKGDKYHEWTPNTITYRLKANSEEGRKAFRAKMGIVVHTKYEGKSLGELQPTPYVDIDSFGENPDVHLMPARVDMTPENWKPKDRADFSNALENAKILYGRMKPEAFDEVVKHSDLLDLYFNEAVKGKTHTDVDEYVKFLTRLAEKEAGKLKTPARQEAVRRKFAELAKHVQANQKHFKDAFALRDHLSKAKETLMRGIRQNTSDYEYYINGKKTGPEGYVVYRDGQDAVKLVDRKEFSKMNFELAKMKKPTYPVPAAPPIVMAFGRMNPPTGGHEGVINKVKEVASQAGAAHEIVLSASEDPEKNPLTPEQKVKYAKKFFPGTNITAATKDAPDFLTHAARMFAAGHRELIMVAGPDRIDEFRKLLAAYNGKQGRHGYYRFDHIKVVQSDRIPGKSGTEMRGYAERGDYDSFRAGLPSTASPTDVRSLYRDVKRAQQHKPALNESRWVQTGDPGRIYKNPSISRIKSIAKNSKYHEARYVIDKKDNVYVGDADKVVHSDLASDYEGNSKAYGFVDYQGGSVESRKNTQGWTHSSFGPHLGVGRVPRHPKIKQWQGAGIKRLTYEDTDLEEAVSRPYLHKFKTFGKKFAPQTDCGPKGTSGGACAATSHKLYSALKKKGKDVHFVVGSYDEKGKHAMDYSKSEKGTPKKKLQSGDVNHAWIEHGNKIIDVTHNQFGPKQRTWSRTGKEKHSYMPVGTATVITQKEDPRYKEYKRDDAAVRHVKRGWPKEQQPTWKEEVEDA